MWQWTPDATTPTYADVRWTRMFDAGFTHPQVCLADGAKYISFYARGAVGGEKITVGGSGIPTASEVEVTLTNQWAVYSAPLTGVTYNTYDSGVENVSHGRPSRPALRSRSGSTTSRFEPIYRRSAAVRAALVVKAAGAAKPSANA